MSRRTAPFQKWPIFFFFVLPFSLTASVGLSSDTSWHFFFLPLRLFPLPFCAPARVCTGTHVCLCADCLCLCRRWNHDIELRCSLKIQQCFPSRWVLRIESSAHIFRAVFIRQWDPLFSSLFISFIYLFSLPLPLFFPLVKQSASAQVTHVSLSSHSWTRHSKYQSLPPALAVYTRRRSGQRRGAWGDLLRALLFIQGTAL